jgi:predicted AAA+ superfamily ATPase
MSSEESEDSPIKLLERLRSVHQRLHNTMAELVERKDYAATESLLRVTDKMVLDLIDDAEGWVVRPGAESL